MEDTTSIAFERVAYEHLLRQQRTPFEAQIHTILTDDQSGATTSLEQGPTRE